MLKRAYYSASLPDFLATNVSTIVGEITSHFPHDVVVAQRDAWMTEIRILQQQLQSFDGGHIFLEFSIPRMGKRADVIYLTRQAVFVIEFKVGETSYPTSDIAQAVDYAVDLKNFHEASHCADIVPILVATKAHLVVRSPRFGDDGVADCLCCNADTLGDSIRSIQTLRRNSSPLVPCDWLNSSYKPTPTIVQAAQSLYRNHDVSEISRSDASAKNLSETTDAIGRVIETAKANNEKAICFVTGVPGAGKTLAGLNITTSRMNHHREEHAVFLSGNGPLVAVLRAALAKDERQRCGISLKEAQRNSHAFIQNIHHFRDEYLQNCAAPVERVVVFDEAQRAWDQKHTTKFMRTKKGFSNFDASEPEFLIEVMDRHSDWCVIVALIGGGQEINSGEAGLPEWFHALRRKFPSWKVYFSDRLTSQEYTKSENITSLTRGLSASSVEGLHLRVSIRSFRAENLSDFVRYLIDNSPEEARGCYDAIRNNYPIYLTRDLSTARDWVQSRKRGSELYGIIASSGAKRLRPEGLNVAAKIDPETWFLNGASDVRSCQYLEEVATEFDIQGLELDWSIVGWDANLRRTSDEWAFYKFVGTRWQVIRGEVDRQYLLNAYRVLLTRARQGIIIYVPQGNASDLTRVPEYYDPIYSYLQNCGVPSL